MTFPRPRIGLSAVIVITAVALWSADIFLARTENIEMQTEARHDAEAARRALAQGRAEDAVSLFRKAHALDRENSGYALELAQALMAAGKLSEAQSILSDNLENSPNDGQANLLEARLMVRQGKIDQASAYYHRAIYGIWPENPVRHRVEVRLELANLLASHHASQELLAELLPLETEAQNDLSVRKQVARLYLVADAPDRADAAYRALIRDDSDDGDNDAGLGEAALALGNYRAAQVAFQNAIHHGAQVQNRLDLAAQMADLDPTPRRLSAMEKFTRSARILLLARDALASCASSDRAKPLLEDADAALGQKIRGDATNETAEKFLALAQDIWQLRVDTCAVPSTPNDEPLRLIMAKLSQ